MGSRGIERRGSASNAKTEEKKKAGKEGTVQRPTQESIKKKERIIVKELGKRNRPVI